MSSRDTHSAYIAQDEGICAGAPRITGTRLKVQQVALEYDRLGWSTDQICDAHPGISLPQVHAALSYYYEHKQEIDQAIANDQEFTERMRAELS